MYNVMDTICREMQGGISLPLAHYVIIICNDLGADCKNMSSEEACVVF